MNEKQINRYLRAVRRRLALPRAQRDRVIEDLRCSIAERQEAGQSAGDILAALGSAKQAAAELNAQMQAETFRKSPLRFVCLAAAIAALAVVLAQTIANLRGFANVGVIGGADGPTAIFITGPQICDWIWVILAGIVLLLGLAGFFLLRRLPPKKQ